MAAYIIYTSNLPNDKCAVHFIVDLGGYEYSQSKICANPVIAKHDAHVLACNWIKQVLTKFINQREVALKQTGVNAAEITAHKNAIFAITHKHQAIKIYNAIFEKKAAIDFFLPCKDSAQSYWLPIIDQLRNVAHDQLNVLIKQQKRTNKAA
jgi:hypothetical protein